MDDSFSKFFCIVAKISDESSEKETILTSFPILGFVLLKLTVELVALFWLLPLETARIFIALH